MHKVFGEKLNIEYTTRKGAYLIPINGDKVAVVKTPKGYFFLGGGIEEGETDTECIIRECREETGCEVTVGQQVCSAENFTYHKRVGYFHPVQTYYTGTVGRTTDWRIERDHTLMWIDYTEIKGRMFSEMQNWALDICWRNYR